MTILTKKAYDLYALIKISVAFFNRTRTKDSKICMETKNSQITKTVLRKNKTGGFAHPDF